MTISFLKEPFVAAIQFNRMPKRPIPHGRKVTLGGNVSSIKRWPSNFPRIMARFFAIGANAYGKRPIMVHNSVDNLTMRQKSFAAAESADDSCTLKRPRRRL